MWELYAGCGWGRKLVYIISTLFFAVSNGMQNAHCRKRIAQVEEMRPCIGCTGACACTVKMQIGPHSTR